MYKIIVNREKCIGCGSCVSICDNFELDEDGKSKPIKDEVEELGCSKDAAEICPVEAIEIKE
ncbi:MAG: ferredoxin [Candidatus Aenigmarchaeota archaeon ex4484_56]|nr:MAG: ferredoxin [Candidatus Aenigmarchaeota archaeon ex4484_56]